jgi:hypothetical protein
MKKRLMILISLSLLILAGSVWLVSCETHVSGTALLQGAVTIGPITPVEQPGQCPTVSPETFASRKIMIFNESGDKILIEVSIIQIGQTAIGYYTVLLAPGTYTIDINHLGIDSADNLPQKVILSAGKTVIVDINIDTGIR